ncbi:SPFH domain-containing protein [Streptomyces sp. WAC05292]|uniref:SPFH domain-containing protein n=1 Tax=Streptomyces sp. WAC05292 TaxID=2487418 RepID=UPI0021B006FB|nr:SPFH domain-containing protein [Streptomyces sp. WAC05292]
MPAADTSPYADPAAGPAAAAAAAQARPHSCPAARVAVAPAPVRSRWVAGVPSAMVLTAREVLLPHGRAAADTATALGDVPAARTEPGQAPAAPAEGGGTVPGDEGGAAPGAPAPAAATLDIPHPAVAPDPQAAPPAAGADASDKDAPPGPQGTSRDSTPDPAAEPGPAAVRHAAADADGGPGSGDGSREAPGAHTADPSAEPAPYEADPSDGPAPYAADPADGPTPYAADPADGPTPYTGDPADGPCPYAAAAADGGPGIAAGTADGSGPYTAAAADGGPGPSGETPGPYEADPAGVPGPYAAAGPVGGGSASPDGPVGVPGPAVAGGAATRGAEGDQHGVPAGRGSVVEIVSRAVARGIGDGGGEPAPAGISAAARGVDVTAVPVHLPFPAEPRTHAAGAPAAAPGRSARRAVPRPVPGRRVPQGDDRLREHRGPVLPGWVGVAVGGLALSGCLAVLWRAGAVPDAFAAAFGAAPRAYQGLRATHWPPLAFLGIVALLSLGGLGRGKVGHAWVLTLFGRYRGTVRRTGLTWVSPLLLRRRIDVRLRHWRSDPMPAVDCGGLALQVVVQVVWQVKDTARAALAVEDHTEYLAEQVEAAMARVLSQLPADAFHEDAPTLRDTEAVGEALTRMLAAETEAVGIEVYSAQPTRIEYAPEVAEAMRRRRVAAIDAKHRDTVLTSVVDAVDDTVHRLTSRGLVELDDYERKALVKDLTVAFYTGRSE